MKKLLRYVLCLGPVVLLTCSESLASPFGNLGFEDVQLPWNGSWGTLVPYWGPSGVINVGLNEPPSWEKALIVYDQNCPVDIPFEDRFGLAMFPTPSATQPWLPPTVQTLVQGGDLPADAGLIHFKNWGERVRVFLGGQEIPITYSGDSGVGDISAFAGQNVTLKFQTLPATTWPQYSALDSVWFSPIPEPSTFALLGFGGLGLGWWLRRRGRH